VQDVTNWLALLYFILLRRFLSSLTISNSSYFTRSPCSSITFQNFEDISDVLSEVSCREKKHMHRHLNTCCSYVSRNFGETNNIYFYLIINFWHLYVWGGLHYRMTLRTVPSDRDVRSRFTGFRVDLGTRYVTVRVLQEGVGRSFQKYFYNRYKILHTCQNLFDWFSRWPWNTSRNRMCVVGRSGGSF
jgi:hypothetical protein